MLAQAVFFDVGGTLVFGNFGHIDLLHQALRAIGFKVKRDEVTEANDLARQAVARRRRRLAARMNTVTASRMWLEHLAGALGVDLGEMDLGAALAGAIRMIEAGSPARLDPDAPALLTNLRQRGYKLGVISNWPADLPAYLEGHGLAKFFDVIVASEAVGSAKPHREIFLRALAAIGCESRLAVHVGDDYWADVVGARELGIAPVLIDRLGEDVHSDCLTITRLAELSHLLDPHAL